MTDWTRPESLTTEELVGFLLNEHEMHAVAFGYTDGVGVVGGVYKEAARRLARSEAALKPVMDYDYRQTCNLDDFMASVHCMNIINEAQRIYNGGVR